MAAETTHAIDIDAAEEHFHARRDHPHWNESAWFGVVLPERRTTIYVYLFHRPNMRRSAGGVKVWDPSASSEYDCLGYGYNRHLAPPAGADMFDLTLDNGLSVKMVEPFGHFRIRHRGALDLDLEWRRIAHPFAFGQNQGLDGWTTESVGFSNGHYQQYGRMTGTVTVGGETIAVDQPSIRDRSWGPRDAVAARRMELMWCCASERTYFSVLSVSTHRPAQDAVIGVEDCRRLRLLLPGRGKQIRRRRNMPRLRAWTRPECPARPRVRRSRRRRSHCVRSRPAWLGDRTYSPRRQRI